MQISSAGIISFYIASFVNQACQYCKINSDRRIFSPQFSMMFVAIFVMLANVFFTDGSAIYFVLEVVSLALSLYMIKLIRLPGH